ncbi:MAG TPA: ABC transporter permease [Burkholderiales bacterium]|nr:ABC transporter permease [Burkholderiales bacterium]
MRRLRPFILIILILAAWETAARSGLWSPLLFPSLERIGKELWLFVSRSDGWWQTWVSLYRTFGGFALAAVMGVALGMLMGRSALVAELLDPLFSGTYAVPKLALFPIFIFLFGLGSLSKVALIFLECLYPMTIITYHGAKSVNPVLIWSAQNMGASRLRTLARVVFPAMLPYVFAALRVALPVALIVAIITEMISSVDGLGYLVSYSLSSLKTDRMLAIVVVISALGLVLVHALVALRNRLVYWEKLDTFYV